MNVRDRMQEYLDYKGITPYRLEKDLGKTKGYWGKTKNPTAEFITLFVARYNDISESWLLTGEGEMLKDMRQTDAVQDTASNPTIGTLLDYETWLLPQTAHGGSLTNIPAEGVLLQNCEKIISPIKGVDFAISVYGDSMAPEYPSGSRVLIKRINPDAYIDWGKAYVLDTCNGVILKEVLKCEREGYVTCHSINPDPKFADFDVLMSDIYGIYRVLMCLSAK